MRKCISQHPTGRNKAGQDDDVQRDVMTTTHPDLPAVVSCCEASTVPGESAASDAVLVSAQRVNTLPGLTEPDLEEIPRAMTNQLQRAESEV